jgi:RNA recognition motif-containing protein
MNFSRAARSVSRQSKGFGFVEMANAEDCSKAIQQFNDTELKGRNVKVSEARPREWSLRGHNRSGGGGSRSSNRW